MTAIDEIKSRVDIIDLVSESVKLRHSGKNYTGFCPFHQNTHTPAFVVFPDSGTWRCFGECNEGGDVFKFVMKKEGWDFPQALKYLAGKAGVELEPLTPQKKEADEKYERLRGLLEEAVTFYRYQLTQTPAGKEALAYLTKRGLQPATLETFGLGYAPDGWETSVKHFIDKGYTIEDLQQVGLVTDRQERSGVYDRFRHRIMFPIRDSNGRMCGFGARILRSDDIPKFLNSPQTPLFDKGHLLYGLDQARKPIRAQDQVVIVEGYLDVIILHQAGYTNTVSPMGTALTDDQLRLLKRLTRRIVLALDADAAGEKATLRGLELARQTMDHSPEIDALHYNPHGLVQYEGRLDADIRITTLPPGMDPDEVVLGNPAGWADVLKAAKPVVTHVMDTLTAGADLDDPKVKSEIARQVLTLIEDVPDPVERDTYRQRLARLLRVDERSLVGGQRSTARSTTRRAPQREKPATVRPEEKASERPGKPTEEHCLGILLRQPELVFIADRVLQSASLGRFSEQDFENSDHQMLAHLVLEAINQDALEPQEYVHEKVPQPLEEMVDRLAAPPTKEPAIEKMREDLVRTIITLRLHHVNESIRQLRYLQEGVQDQNEGGMNPFQDQILQLAQLRARLDQSLARPLQFD